MSIAATDPCATTSRGMADTRRSCQKHNRECKENIQAGSHHGRVCPGVDHSAHNTPKSTARHHQAKRLESSRDGEDVQLLVAAHATPSVTVIATDASMTGLRPRLSAIDVSSSVPGPQHAKNAMDETARYLSPEFC